MLPEKTFANDVVMVTGGGTGIGRAIAVEFARLGAAVAIASRKEEHRAHGVAAVNEVGGRGIGVALDVRDPDAHTAGIGRIGADGGRGPIRSRRTSAPSRT